MITCKTEPISYIISDDIPVLYVDRYNNADGYMNLLEKELPGAAGTVPAADIAVYEDNPVVSYIEGHELFVMGYFQ